MRSSSPWRRFSLYQKEARDMRAISDLMASLTQLTDGAARGIRKTGEDPPRICVYDLIGAVTGQTVNARGVIFKRLKENFPEVSTFCCDFQFSG